MNYLVIGGAGYLGSHLVSLLMEQGHKVYLLDNYSGHIRNVHGLNENEFFGDITQKESFQVLKNSLSIDGVFHLAAKKSVVESILQPDIYESVNIDGTSNVLNFCLEYGIRNIVFTSSAAVYGAYDSKVSISEYDPANPINPYGKSKLDAENVIAQAVKDGEISAICLRVFNMIGSQKKEYMDGKGENVLPAIFRSLQSDIEFFINGNSHDTADGTCVRDFVNVDDVAKSHMLAMKYLETGNKGEFEIINICSGKGTSVLELIGMINLISAQKVSWAYTNKRAGDPASVIGNPKKAMNILGWQAEIETKESLEQSLKFFL
jgi:UDP-glucose 4-epimerase